MSDLPFQLAKQVNRVPSMSLPLDAAGENRFQNLMEDIIMIDLHEHPMVCTEPMDDLVEYLRYGQYEWGYEAIRHGGWTAVATANVFRGMMATTEMSHVTFADLADEIGMMVADARLNSDNVAVVTSADEILAAKQTGKIGVFPTVEHLAISDALHRVDVLYSMGVRMAGLTYNLQNSIGCGLTESRDSGITDFGAAVIERMNDLGMAVDVSHAGYKTASDAIERSKAPIIFSHNASHSLRPTWRTRKDDELIACAKRGGLVAVTAVPNALSDSPTQDIGCVLDHYDYLVNLVGVDHVGIGTDTLIGDHVGYHRKMMGRGLFGGMPAPYLNGLESPADGKNLIRGFITRGYSDVDIRKLAGGNALNFIRRVVG